MTNEEFIASISQEGEVWKEIPGYSMYQVSNLGRVLTLKEGKNIQQKNVMYRRVLIPTVSDTGYLRVSLYDDGIQSRKVKLVHRLVALAFLPNENDYPYVDHINTNRQDNRVDNLRWATPKMNANNPLTIAHNKASSPTIRWNTRGVVQLSKTGEFIQQFKTAAIAAKETGCHDGAICRCCQNYQSLHHGFKWMYLDEYNELLSKDQSLN